jgi:hypothetical protein
MEYINGVDSLKNNPPIELSDKQVELLEKQKAAGTAQDKKKDDETVPF